MKRRITTIGLVLALILSLGTVAFAATTDGSIKFKEGDVIIIPPNCCPCFGRDPENGCKCKCHDYDEPGDPDDYKKFDMGGNLFFGEWKIGTYGVFNSIDKEQTTDVGTHSGILVINQTSQESKVEVKITDFFFDRATGKKLDGAELTLMAHEIAFGLGFGKDDATQGNNLTLEPDTGVQILATAAGSRVKASWYGLLDVLPGTAVHQGTAQATLTWTNVSAAP